MFMKLIKLKFLFYNYLVCVNKAKINIVMTSGIETIFMLIFTLLCKEFQYMSDF